MNLYSFLYILFFCLTWSFVVVIFLTPKVKAFGVKNNFFDNSSPRKVNRKPLVRIGGISLFLSIASIVLGLFIFQSFNHLIFESRNYIYSIFFFSFIYFLIGLLDDLFDLSFILRLAIQLTISIFAWNNGIGINSLDFSYVNSSYIIELPSLLSLIITSLWLVGVTNSINWMDGIDGLCSTLTIISCLGISVISIYKGSFYMALYSISIAGACIGFLRYNLFPSQILMGDCGSNFLGFNLAALSLLQVNNPNSSIKILASLLILFVPLFDMVRVVFSRLISKSSPFIADNTHLHHIFLKLGLGYVQVVICISSFAQWFTTLSVLLFLDSLNLKMMIPSTSILVFGLIYVLLNRRKVPYI